MTELVQKAIADYQIAEFAYAKFTTPNNVGATGSHESGWLISKSAWRLFFDKEGMKGELKDRYITIKWQDDFDTQSRFIYYGQKTRNEYRLTRFGKGFPFLKEDNIGDYVIILRLNEETYKAYVLRSDDEIEDFTTTVGISVTDTNKLLVPQRQEQIIPAVGDLINKAAEEVGAVMPGGAWIAAKAFEINIQAGIFSEKHALTNPDDFLLELIKTEYELFQAIERNKYGKIVAAGFASVEQFISTAHSILNSRKSRAGHSLENHLATIFDKNNLMYEQQVVTEGKKTADFIFPGGESYHDPGFRIEDLFFMAAKTTCKDRWRQILNEADNLEVSYLMTLQQGISKSQLQEMKNEQVILVIPSAYKKTFPHEYHADILSLEDFVRKVQASQ